MVVGGLSLLRAFTPLAILPAAEYVPVDGDRADVVRKVVALLVVGVVAVIIPWLLMIILAKKAGGPTRRSSIGSGAGLGSGRWASFVG